MNNITHIPNRHLAFDIIKTISSFMVILYHLSIVDNYSVCNLFYFPNLSKILLGLCAMSVPLFFMVNGALSIKRNEKFSYYLFKFVKTIFLYVFWNFAFDFIYSLLGINKGFSFSFPATHLWFLRTLSVLYLVGYLNNKLSNIKIFVVIGCILLFIFPFSYNYAILACKTFSITLPFIAERTGFFTLYSILYYFTGSYLWEKYIIFHKRKFSLALKIILLIFGLLLVTTEVVLWSNINKEVFDGVNASFPTIGALSMATSAFLLACRIKLSDNNFLSKFFTIISKNCLGIYVLHPIVIIFIKKLYTGQTNIIGGIAFSLITMTISFIISFCSGKIPIIKKLFKI